jgi:hypothetical protein
MVGFFLKSTTIQPSAICNHKISISLSGAPGTILVCCILCVRPSASRLTNCVLYAIIIFPFRLFVETSHALPLHLCPQKQRFIRGFL